MTRHKKMRALLILFSLFSLTIIGCGGGGGSGSSGTSTPSPTLSVHPADNYDFGIVTDGNSVQPLIVTLENSGNADLAVSSISLSDTSNFQLNLNGGTNPCGPNAVSLSAGSSCTASVDFTPTSTDSFNADLTIDSNDPASPTYTLALAGKNEAISSIKVKINQIEACPRPSPPHATIYVSVTDQGGFPVTGLGAGAFAITEAGTPVATNTADHVGDTVTLSVVLLMDYSDSITYQPANVTDMENAASNFVNDLGPNDEAEIIKYGTTIDVAQPFTSDKTSLTTAIDTTPSVGGHTALYDALVQAINDISASTKDRKAIIIMTDGKDDDGSGNPISTNTLGDVVDDANADGVPVFTVGLGEADVSILQQIADQTGGTFSPSTTSGNLSTIYTQLASLLFTNQYILTYSSNLGSTATGNLTVKATYSPSITGTDTKSITACP